MIALAALAALLVVALLAWLLVLRFQAADLDEKIARAEAEMKRLAYVMKRDAELHARVVSLRTQLVAQAAEGIPESPTPGGALLVTEPAPPPTPAFPSREHVEHQRSYLEDLLEAIEKGQGVEKRLPPLERHVVQLEDLLSKTSSQGTALKRKVGP